MARHTWWTAQAGFSVVEELTSYEGKCSREEDEERILDDFIYTFYSRYDPAIMELINPHGISSLVTLLQQPVEHFPLYECKATIAASPLRSFSIHVFLFKQDEVILKLTRTASKSELSSTSGAGKGSRYHITTPPLRKVPPCGL